MKQRSLISFFSGGKADRKSEDKNSKASVSAPTEGGATYLDAVENANGVDAAYSDATDLSDDKTASSVKPSSGAKSGISHKRRMVDSDDDSTGLSDAEAAEAAEAVEDNEEPMPSDSATDLDEEPVKAPAKKPAAKKPTAKKTKVTVGESKQRPELSLIETKEGKMVPFLALCKEFEAIESTTKRLEITGLIKDFFVQAMRVDEQQLTEAVMLCIAKIAPDHEGIELGIGESILIKAIGVATGRQPAKVKQDQQELGDLGKVVQRGKSNQRTMFKPKPLSISKVFSTFKDIASTSGSSSIQKKQSLIAGLLASCTDIEAKYLIRLLEGKLRIGLAESTVQTALAQAALIYEKGDKVVLEPSDFQKAAEDLKQVLSEYPIYSTVISAIYENGISDVLNRCMLTPTLPVKPMLAKIEKAAADILKRFEGKPFTCEYKYDGERSQVHYVEEGDASKCVVFSRNAENNTDKYPDIVRSVKEFAKPGTTSFILDCEAVAWDVATGKIRSFQTLSSRKKKVGHESEIKVGVCCFVFDLLYLNGEPLIRLPLRKRRELLCEHFAPVKNKFQFAVAQDLTEVEDIQGFLEQSVQDNCEGLMIKLLDGEGSSYEPSKRSQNWLKLKKDYVSGLGDSLDLVVIGAYFGKGKRVGAYGSFLLACYDPEREEYQTICKIGTGFSDADLESYKSALDQSVIAAPKPYYASSESTKPDVWFEPTQVWEVKSADLSLSSTYQAAFGQVAPDKGISLRFPRFVRVRDDKSPEEATSSAQVAEMYDDQMINQ